MTSIAETTTTTAPDGPVETTDVTTGAQATEQTSITTEDAQGATGKRRSLEDSLAPLDESTRKYVLEKVRSANNEAKNLRDRARDADSVKAEIATTIAKALGMEPEQAPPDPAALAAQLTEQTTKARQAAVELSVYRAAAVAGGDPSALLDSVSFVRSLTDIDPNDTDAITDKVKAAVAANPALGTTPVRRAPGPNPAAGSSANGYPDLESEIAAAQKAGDIARVIHLQNQKLASAKR